jgi:C4-dicarboxylate-specific signal transduction histidine kinase
LERKRAFAEHRRLEEEVHQIARVATMGELTAALSHELTQPLRSNSEQCEACSASAGIHNS